VKRGGVPFMPRKPLDALEGLTLASAGQVSSNTCPDASRRVRGLGRGPSGLAERNVDQLNRFRYWLLACAGVLSVILHYSLPGGRR
jgi:hypothetical protein